MIGLPKNFNLGYACICTELHEQGIFSSRTLRLATLKEKGMKYVQELALQNLEDLYKILVWNVEHNIFFFRVSSEMFPFASHIKYGYTLEFADKLLKKIGAFANKHGIRLTAHPGPFNQIASLRDTVVLSTIRDLAFHCEMFDRMKLPRDSVLILHGGGTYDDRPTTLKRLILNLSKLPKKIFNRIVLENDEFSYNIEELLVVSEKLKIPLVIDFHHDSINPSSKPAEHYFDRVFKIWQARKMTPKIHVSNSVPGILIGDTKTARRKHSDHITFLHKSIKKIKFPLDIMLECKQKEQSIFILRKMNTKDIFQKLLV